jgi:hypothetical protein
MKSATLEDRVADLEVLVKHLGNELRKVRQKDWKRTIGMFTDDEEMKSIFKEALKLREADRKKARSRSSKSQKPKR